MHPENTLNHVRNPSLNSPHMHTEQKLNSLSLSRQRLNKDKYKPMLFLGIKTQGGNITQNDSECQ